MSKIPSKASGIPRPSAHASRESLASVRATTSTGSDGWQVGDRCYVNGTRPGTVAFIGETQFAKDMWAGVELDVADGKNDGTVSGVQYFQCEKLCGLFCKPQKLSRVENASFLEGQAPAAEVARASSMEPSLQETAPDSFDVHAEAVVGERVEMMGNRVGHVRYVGECAFAKGTWAGVELDTPDGKNDGSVQGKRYFACKPQYGIFLPIHKVTRCANQTPSKFTIHHTKTSRLRLRRTGSNESLASGWSDKSYQSSVLSSVAPKFRATHKSTGAPIREREENLLRERQRHIEQLLHEQEQSRQEIAALHQRCDSLVKHADALDDVKNEMIKYRDLYEDAQRKAEDLSFCMEEEKIMRSELEAKVEAGGDGTAVDDNTSAVVDELKARLASVNTAKEALDTALGEASTRENGLHEKVVVVETRMADLVLEHQRQVAHLEVEKTSTITDAESQATREASLIEQATTSAAKLAELEARLLAVTGESDSGREKVDALHAEKAVLESKLGEQSSASIEMETALKAKAAELATANESKVEIEQRAASLQGQLDTLRSHSETTIKELKEEVLASRTAAENISAENQLKCDSNIVETKKDKALIAELQTNEKKHISEMSEVVAKLEEAAKAQSMAETARDVVLAESASSTAALDAQIATLRIGQESSTVQLTNTITEMEKTNATRCSEWEAKMVALKVEGEKLANDRSSEVIALQTQLDAAQKELSTSSSSLMEARQAGDESDSIVTSLKRKLDVLATEHTAAVNDWNVERGKLTNEARASGVELDALRECVGRTEKECGELVSQLESEKTSVTTAKSELATALSRSTAAESTVAKLEHSLSEENARLAASIAQVEASEALVKTTTSDFEETKKSLAIVRAEHESSTVEADRLRSLVDEQTKHMDELKTEAHMHSGELEKRLSDEKEKLFVELQAVKLDLVASQTLSETTAAQLAESQRHASVANAQAETDIERLTAEGKTMKAECEETTRELAMATTSLTTATSSLEDVTSKVSILEGELATATTTNQEMTTTMDELRENLSTTVKDKVAVEQDVEKLGTEALESNANLARLREEMKKQQSEMAAGGDVSESLSRERDALVAQLAELSTSTDERVAGMKAEHEKAEAMATETMSKTAAQLLELTAANVVVVADLDALKASTLTAQSTFDEQRQTMSTTIARLEAELVASSASMAETSAAMTAQLAAANERACEEKAALVSKLDVISTKGDGVDATLAERETELTALREQLVATETLLVDSQTLAQSTAKEIVEREATMKTLVLAKETTSSEVRRPCHMCGVQLAACQTTLSTTNAEKERLTEFVASLTKKTGETEHSMQETMTDLRQQLVDANVIKEKLAESETSVVSLKEVVSAGETEKQRLEIELGEVRAVVAEMADLREMNTSLQTLLTEEKRSMTDSSDAERTRLANELDEMRSVLAAKDVELSTLSAQTSSHAVETQCAETDRDALRARVSHLEESETALRAQLLDAESVVPSTTPISATPPPPMDPQSEEQRLKQQVEFLNDIIATQQKKNGKLEKEMELMRNAHLDMDKLSKPIERETAPRVYCDICEVFDEHGTDECPQQASDELPTALMTTPLLSDSAGHSRHRGVRKANRTYCDNCEEFGHDTDDCVETF